MAKNAKSENSWERLPGESAKAFEAFDLYCKLGEERSIRKVAQKLNKSTQLLGRWSSQWDWVNRSRDYDNEIKREEIREQKKAYKAMQQRQTAIAVKMQKVALEALKKLSTEDMKPKDIREFIKTATDLERLNCTFEEEIYNTNTAASLADEIVAAYLKREGKNNV